MNQFSFPETKRNKVLFTVFITLMLYLARDTLFTHAIVGFTRGQLLMLGITAVVALVFLANNLRQWKQILLNRRMVLVLVSAAVMVLPMVAKGDWQLMYFSILFCLLFAVFLSYFVNYRDAAKVFVLILTVIGAYSVIATYLLRILPDKGLLPVPVFENVIGKRFYNFFVSYVSISYVKRRNFGIFREPGVYQFFLILAMYLNHYAVCWKKPSRMWLCSGILAVTMLSTFATGGVIEMGILAVVVFFDKKLYKNKKIRLLVMAGIGLAAVAVAISAIQGNGFYREAYDMLIGKFVYQKDSVQDRFGSLFVNLEFFLRSPLWGAGIAEVLFAIPNNTSSTTIMFAIFGLFGGLLHVAGWFALVWRREQALWVNLALLLLLFMSFNTQNLTADVFFWLFPMMALTERVLDLKKQED